MAGRNKKSANNANAMITAVNNPMPEFSSKLDVERTRKPAMSTIDVINNARPTVLNA
jgi:hypothetical protein